MFVFASQGRPTRHQKSSQKVMCFQDAFLKTLFCNFMLISYEITRSWDPFKIPVGTKMGSHNRPGGIENLHFSSSWDCLFSVLTLFDAFCKRFGSLLAFVWFKPAPISYTFGFISNVFHVLGADLKPNVVPLC